MGTTPPLPPLPPQKAHRSRYWTRWDQIRGPVGPVGPVHSPNRPGLGSDPIQSQDKRRLFERRPRKSDQRLRWRALCCFVSTVHERGTAGSTLAVGAHYHCTTYIPHNSLDHTRTEVHVRRSDQLRTKYYSRTPEPMNRDGAAVGPHMSTDYSVSRLEPTLWSQWNLKAAAQLSRC